jgi:flagellar hook-associated protein 1 FlgK
MASTFFGVEIALRGILAQQRALEVTSHNISNANTEGYTRQRTTLVQSTPFDNGTGGLVGSGVDVQGYQRVRDSFIDIQLRAQTMKAGYAEARQDGLTQITGALNEPGETGINTLLSRFFASWQDVANAPEDSATRSALIQNAAGLAGSFRDLSDHIDVVTAQTGVAVTNTVDEINSIGGRIANLNVTIAASREIGHAPNDLLDQRDILLDRLGELTNVSWTETATGIVDVTAGGASLVSGTTANTLAETDFTSLTSGKLAALVELRDTTLPGYVTSLNGIAKALADGVNAQHAAGYDLATGAAGGAFFTYTAGSEAASLSVAAAIAANPRLIAASDTAPGSVGAQAGNSGNAIAIAALAGSPAISGAYIQLVNRIGSDTQEIGRELANAKALSSTLETRRQAMSGVSLDEEMTNLIKYQRGFQAASRAFNAMDDALELLISRTGRAGL